MLKHVLRSGHSIRSSATLALALLFAGCETLRGGSGESSIPPPPAIFPATETTYYAFDTRGGEKYTELERQDGDLRRAGTPSEKLGTPIAVCKSGDLCAVVYPLDFAVLDVVENSVQWQSHNLQKRPVSVAMSADKIAVTSEREVNVFGSDNFEVFMREDLGTWLEDTATSKLCFALPVEDTHLFLMSYRRRRPLILSQLVPLTGNPRAPSRPVKFEDQMTELRLQATTHDESFVYVAGELPVEEADGTVDYMVVRSWTTSTEKLEAAELLRVKWPRRQSSGTDKTVRVGSIRQLFMEEGLIVTVHEDHELRAYRERGEVLVESGVLSAAISGKSVLTVRRITGVDETLSL